MRWLGLTVGLLGASLCLVAWVYLRDRDTSDWQLPEGRIARVDAASTLTALGGDECRPACRVRVLGRVQPGRWLVLLTFQGKPQCLRIDLDAFAIGKRGLSGVRSSRCQLAPASPQGAPVR